MQTFEAVPLIATFIVLIDGLGDGTDDGRGEMMDLVMIPVPYIFHQQLHRKSQTFELMNKIKYKHIQNHFHHHY